MATIKLGTTKSANRLISYAEKKAVLRDGLDCDPEYAKGQLAMTRNLHGKTDGIQAHHVIQSFKPGEITPEHANKVGMELAQKLGKGHECVVYTHSDKNHIHNHIIINSVNHENGKKFQQHGKKAIDKIRNMSDEICKEKGLSIIKEPSSKERYSLAEKSIIEKGQISWKDEIRQAIDFEKKQSKSYEEFKKNLDTKYGIKVNDKRKHITYKHPDKSKVVRGNKLGLDYERSTIENEFNRKIETSKERGSIRKFTGGDERTEQTNAELHKSADENGNNDRNNSRARTEKNTKHLAEDTRENVFDIESAREHARRLHKNINESYGKWKDGNDNKQSKGPGKDGADRRNSSRANSRNQERDFGPSR